MFPRSPLSFTRLEDRTTPAASFLAGTLSVSADQGSSLVISEVLDANFIPTGQLSVADHNVNVLVTPLNQPVDALTVAPGPTCQDYTLTMGPTGALATLNVTITGAATSTQVDLGGALGQGGNFAFTGTGNGKDTVTLNAATIAGDATVDLKGGDNVLNLFTGTIAGKLSVAGGPGSDQVNMGAGGPVNVGGNAQFNLGDGDNVVEALGQNLFKVTKDLTYTGGIGSDRIDFDTIAAPVQIGGKLTVGFGKPSIPGESWFSHDLAVGLGATFTGGGADVALKGTTNIGGTLAVSLPGTGGSLQLAAGSVGALQYVGGPGSDTISLAAAGDVTIAKSFTAHMGNGANAVNGSGSFKVTVGGDFQYSGGAGSDSIDFTPHGTALAVGGKVTVALRGAGAGQTNAWGSAKLDVAGAVSITGTGSKNQAQAKFTGDTDIKGNLAITLGSGDNTVAMDPYGLFNLMKVEGSFKYVGGAGKDVVDVDRLQVFVTMKVDLGTGTGVDILRLGAKETQGVLVGGNLTIASKAVSHVELVRTQVGGNVVVSTGKEADYVQVDDSTVTGSATFNLGGGNDEFVVDTVASENGLPLPGTVHIVGNLVVHAGAGGDTLDFSSTSGNGVKVDGNVKLIGGAGQDQFFNNVANQYLGTKKEDFELGSGF